MSRVVISVVDDDYVHRFLACLGCSLVRVDVWWPSIMTDAFGCLESSTSRYSQHLRSHGQDARLVMTTVEVYDVFNQVFSSFRQERHWEQLVMQWMCKATRPMCPVLISRVVLVGCDPGFSGVAAEDFHDRASLAVLGWHYTDMHAMFVAAVWHAFGGDYMFAVVDLVLASLRLFVAASWLADAPNLLQVSL